MNYALIKAGVVRNIIEADADFIPRISVDWDAIVQSDTAGIGWAWDGSTFTAPVAPAPAPPSAPASVTQKQARIALSRAGKLDAVNAAIAAMPAPEGDEARIAWEFASVIQRADPLIAQMGQVLGLDDAALDQLFIEAGAIA